MKRIQLFEFEDFSWFPKVLRTGMTHLIVVFHKMTGTPAVLAELIRKVREERDFRRIVDIGSGSGGAMPLVLEAFNAEGGEPLEILLTDLHPNPAFVRQVNTTDPPNLRYHEAPVDATRLGDAPAGLKTMVNSFHHMPPEKARAILLAAHTQKQPFLIYEMGQNNIPTLLWWLLLPLSLSIILLMTWVMTPFVRPLTWQQLLFTYLIPIIPICYTWDGQASLVRMYTFKDLELLLQGLESSDYTWSMGAAKKANGKSEGYYLLGMPA
ncbi:MAG: class I SAM-dependent methyltransferase [Phaeodactylibacter sp.]|nr:class I SAM-dependent methyltransferase [Phaeodactylibacter sp.]